MEQERHTKEYKSKEARSLAHVAIKFSKNLISSIGVEENSFKSQGSKLMKADVIVFTKMLS